MTELSDEFKNLVSDLEEQGTIKEKNCSGGGYGAWEKKRKFVVEAIHDDGTVLDIGCAGGFFLRSLQEWSEYDLVPYGIDIKEEFIEAARDLFPKHKENFVVMQAKDVADLPSRGFPEKFDFIYVSVLHPEDREAMNLLRDVILPMTRKRLIFGFYSSGQAEKGTEEWKEQREDLQKQLESFEDQFDVAGSRMNPTEFNQAIAWIDVS